MLWAPFHRDPHRHPSAPHISWFCWLLSDAKQCPGESLWTSPWGGLMPGLMTVKYGAASVNWLPGKGFLSVLRTGLTSYPGLWRHLSAKRHTQLDRESRNACSAAFFLIPQRLAEVYREAKGWFEYNLNNILDFLFLCLNSLVQKHKRISELSYKHLFSILSFIWAPRCWQPPQRWAASF